jgi:hypothetical protein
VRHITYQVVATDNFECTRGCVPVDVRRLLPGDGRGAVGLPPISSTIAQKGRWRRQSSHRLKQMQTGIRSVLAQELKAPRHRSVACALQRPNQESTKEEPRLPERPLGLLLFGPAAHRKSE